MAPAALDHANRVLAARGGRTALDAPASAGVTAGLAEHPSIAPQEWLADGRSVLSFLRALWSQPGTHRSTSRRRESPWSVPQIPPRRLRCGPAGRGRSGSRHPNSDGRFVELGVRFRYRWRPPSNACLRSGPWSDLGSRAGSGSPFLEDARPVRGRHRRMRLSQTRQRVCNHRAAGGAPVPSI